MGPFLIFAGAGAADVFERQVSGMCVAKMVCILAQELVFVIRGLWTGAGWEVFEVGCGRLWRKKA